MILVRLLAYVRRHWPSTHILVRGDRHCATPEVMEVIAQRRRTDCVFGLAGNPVWLRQAAPVMEAARGLCQQRTALAHAYGEQPPPSSRVWGFLHIPPKRYIPAMTEALFTRQNGP
jgi:hypothetical protein